MNRTIVEVKRQNKEGDNYFFSPESMRFFASKVHGKVLKGDKYFITSEKKSFRDYGREFAIRQAEVDGDINTVESGIATIEKARNRIKELLKS